MTRVLVTGATGFVGAVMCDTLASHGYTVRAALRSDRPVAASVAEKVMVGEVGGSTDWRAAVSGVDIVVHAAARAHIVNDKDANADLYLETNARGTRRLAEDAARYGVRRMVYVSTVKVNGEETGARAYTAADNPAPQDVYGRSKWLGEQYLQEVAAKSGMEAVVVRPPVVYGPGVRANFLRLMRWVRKGWPLPLGSIDNRRSLVSVWNLSDFIAAVLESPAAANDIWLVSDGEDLSTPELIRRIARAMGRTARLLSVPGGSLRSLARVVGLRPEMDRLCGSLVLDITRTRTALGWRPPIAMDEGLRRTVEWYQQSVCLHPLSPPSTG